MTIRQILKAISDEYKRTGRIPKPRGMPSLMRECYRKIGSWRRALWMAGLLPEARKKRLPRLNFLTNDPKELEKTFKKLKALVRSDPHLKEKMI
jgi:hypothetical protein